MQRELDDLTVEELHELARENDLHGYSDLSKDELVEYLDSEGIEAPESSDAGAAPTAAMSNSSDAPVAQRGTDPEEELSELDPVTRRYVEPRVAGSPNPGDSYPDHSE